MDEAHLRLFGQCHESLVLRVWVQGTADHVDACQGIYSLTVFLALKVHMIETVLAVEPVDHTTLDGLYHHYRGVEVCALIHVVDNPVYKGTQEIALTKLNDSFRHHALGGGTLVKCLKFFHDLF